MGSGRRYLDKESRLSRNSGRGAVGFSIGTKGYFGTGFTITSGVTNEFWEYDPAINRWTEKASLPVSAARTEAVGFSIGTKGYIGTGYVFTDDEIVNLNDFWEYDPTTDDWTEKASLPVSSARAEAVGFSIGTKGYIGTGNLKAGIGGRLSGIFGNGIRKLIYGQEKPILEDLDAQGLLVSLLAVKDI